MKLAIDIGSNTIKGILGENVGGRVSAAFEQTLGLRICADGNSLVPGAAAMIAGAISHFKKIASGISKHFETKVVATSALRDSPQRDSVVAEVMRLTGEKIRVLSGEEEAFLSYKGAVSGMDNPRPCTYFDLGGGSLEVVYGDGKKPVLSCSMPVGAVRMTKKFLTGESCGGAKKLSEYLDGVFSENLSNMPSGADLIGAGGAVAAARFMKERICPGDNPAIISATDLQNMARIALSSTPEELVGKYSIEPSRSDIIAAAFLTMHRLCLFLKAGCIRQTFFNLKHGIILEDNK